jgi:Protein of unknown function (DUF2846)
MTHSIRVVLLGLTLAITGMAFAQQKEAANTQTATTGDKAATSNSEVAHLRVYRQKRFTGSALSPSVYVDDKQIARVGNGRCFTMKLTPGSHTVRSDDKSSAITLDAKPGQDYFVRVEEATGFWKGHGKLTLVVPEQGSPEYKLQKPVEEDRKVAKELIEEDKDNSTAAEEKGNSEKKQ